MEFKIIVKKWAVFYFFIQNLSEWHFSCMKDYNITWRKEFGPFIKEQEKALKQFKKIHQNYHFGNLYLGSYFYLRKNPWKKLKDDLPKKDFTDIKSIFSLFKEKFEIFYKNELPSLKEWQVMLKENLKNHPKTKIINKYLSKFYNISSPKKKFKIYLLPSIENITSGWGYIGDNKSMAIAISRWPVKKYNHTIAVIWHESIHRYFEKKHFIPLIKKCFAQDQNIINLIKEATASSLFPNGLLGKKLLNIKAKSLNRKLPNKYNESILKLTESYFKKNKPFDENYINKLYSTIFKLKGILK